MQRRIATVFISLILVLGLANDSLAQELHPKLKSGEKAIRSVLVLPPKVEIVKQGVKGAEGMIKESEDLEAVVLKLVVKVLEEKKIKLINSPFTPEALEGNTELKYSLADAQTRYDELLPKMLKKSSDVAKGRFTMGDEVVKLNPDGSSDALVFIRARGVMPTKGKAVVSAFTFSLAVPLVALSISLVDSRTGEVLLFAKPLAIGDAVDKGEKVLSKPIAKAFKKLPNAS